MWQQFVSRGRRSLNKAQHAPKAKSYRVCLFHGHMPDSLLVSGRIANNCLKGSPRSTALLQPDACSTQLLQLMRHCSRAAKCCAATDKASLSSIWQRPVETVFSRKMLLAGWQYVQRSPWPLPAKCPEFSKMSTLMQNPLLEALKVARI